jgi:hypothetical protein
MKKIISLFLLFILVACSNGVDNDLYKKGQEIVKIIHKSHENIEPSSDKELDKKFAFWSVYKPPKSDEFKNKNEEFLYYLALLNIRNENYLLAIENGDSDKVKEYDKKYKETLNVLKEKFDIEIED